MKGGIWDCTCTKSFAPDFVQCHIHAVPVTCAGGFVVPTNSLPFSVELRKSSQRALTALFADVLPSASRHVPDHSAQGTSKVQRRVKHGCVESPSRASWPPTP